MLQASSNVIGQAGFLVLGTSPITSLQPSKLHRDIGYVPPTDTGSLCLAVDSTHTAVPGLFRLLIRRSGTHCSQMNSEMRRVMSTASNSSLKQSCSALTSVTGALEVNFNVMRSINSRFTYLLTYFVHHGNALTVVISVVDQVDEFVGFVVCRCRVAQWSMRQRRSESNFVSSSYNIPSLFCAASVPGLLFLMSFFFAKLMYV